MQLNTLRLISFSPTGTGRAVTEAMARGMEPASTVVVDITRPEIRAREFELISGDVLLVVAPVYAGRMAPLARQWLEARRLDGAAVICVVIYGNRAFEDALLELTDVVRACGGVPVAGAACIGEHSFSSAQTPIAVGRPDTTDLAAAEGFGRRVKRMLTAAASPKEIQTFAVPGNRPYREGMKAKDLTFTVPGEGCMRCGVCAEVCPTGAIAPEKEYAADPAKCIWCCACVKACPEGARVVVAAPAKATAERLHAGCSMRREPEFFLPPEA